jgi:hypothetical protein
MPLIRSCRQRLGCTVGGGSPSTKSNRWLSHAGRPSAVVTVSGSGAMKPRSASSRSVVSSNGSCARRSSFARRVASVARVMVVAPAGRGGVAPWRRARTRVRGMPSSWAGDGSRASSQRGEAGLAVRLGQLREQFPQPRARRPVRPHATAGQGPTHPTTRRVTSDEGAPTSTRVFHQGNLDPHIPPGLGSRSSAEVTPTGISRLLNEVAAQVSATTADAVYRTCSGHAAGRSHLGRRFSTAAAAPPVAEITRARFAGAPPGPPGSPGCGSPTR